MNWLAFQVRMLILPFGIAKNDVIYWAIGNYLIMSLLLVNLDNFNGMRYKKHTFN